MNSTAKRVLKNTGFLYAKMGITVFISLYTTRLILNGLGTSDFGIFSIIGGAIAMLSFLNVAMAGATQRFIIFYDGIAEKEIQRKIFNISVILHVFVAITAVLILSIAGFFFFNGVLNIDEERLMAAKVVYGSLIISTMFTILTVPYDAILNARENMFYYAVVGVIESFLKLGVALIVVHTSFDKLIVYGILMACTSIITMVIMRIYCHRYYEECYFDIRKYWDKSMATEISRYAGWSFIRATSTMISQYGTGILMNHFFGTLVSAAQGIANQISGQAGALGPQISKSLNPVVVKSISTKNTQQTTQAVLIGTKMMLLVETICFLPIILQTDYVLELWLNQVPEYASIFTSLLLVVNLIDTMYIFLNTAVEATGKIKHFQWTMSLISLAPICICVISFVISAPAYIAYVSMIIASLLKMIAVSFYAHKQCDIYFNFLYKKIASNFAVSFVLAYSLSNFIMLYSFKYFKHSFIFFIFISSVCALLFSTLYFHIGFDKMDRKKIYFKIYSLYKLKFA